MGNTTCRTTTHPIGLHQAIDASLMVRQCCIIHIFPPRVHARIFLCGEMSFSVARSARSILRVCRQSANDLPPSDHSLSVHSTSSPTLHLYRLHRHSSSVPAILVARYLARSRSSRPATAQVPLLIVSPASLCCFVFASACLLAYVSECNTTPSPWWLLCLQWSVRTPLARQSGCQS